MAASTQAYLRFPHVRGDVVTFVADDDVWLAPLAGGVARRVGAGPGRGCARRGRARAAGARPGPGGPRGGGGPPGHRFPVPGCPPTEPASPGPAGVTVHL